MNIQCVHDHIREQATQGYDMPSSKWSDLPNLEVYFRVLGSEFSTMLGYDKPAVVVSSVSAIKLGEGSFTAFMDVLESELPSSGVGVLVIENVLNVRLFSFFERRGFKVRGHTSASNYVRTYVKVLT